MNLPDLPLFFLIAIPCVWLICGYFLVRKREIIGCLILATFFFMPAVVAVVLKNTSIPTGQLTLLFFGPLLALAIFFDRSAFRWRDVGILGLFGLCISLSIVWNELSFWQLKSSLLPVLFAAFLYSSARSPAGLRLLLIVFAAFLGINTVLAGLQWTGNSWAYLPGQIEYARAGGYTRGFGLTDHFSQAGLYSAAVLPIAAIGFMGGNKKKVRGLFLLLAFIGVAGVAFSTLRAAVLGGVAGSIIAMWIYDSRRTLIYLPYTAIILLVFIVSVPTLREAGQGLFEHSRTMDHSARSRPRLAAAGIDAWRQYPVMGGGPNAFDRYVRKNADPHNTYVNILLETGIIGSVAFAFIMYASFRGTRRAYKNGLRAESAAIAGALSATLIVAYFHSLNYIGLFWLCPALALAVGAMRKESGVQSLRDKKVSFSSLQ
jgi:hypothetical protein